MSQFNYPNSRSLNTKIKDRSKALSSFQQNVLIGILLGDGSICRAKPNHNSRLSFKQCTDREQYFFKVHAVFKDFCSSEPRRKETIRNGKTNHYIVFETLSYPCFNFYRDLRQFTSELTIVPNNIGDYLTAEGLAYWIMDDGARAGNSLVLCTDSFSIEEVSILINALQTKFNIKSSYKRSKQISRIYIRVESMETLRNLVLPFFCDSMLYKLGL